MKTDERVGLIDGMTFKSLFSADWLFGQEHIAKLLPRRWEKLHHRMLAKASRIGDGSVYPVERRCELTPQEFRQKYFVSGIPVVLEGAAAGWPAIKKWTPDYLSLLCGHDETKVLDGRNWTVNRDTGQEAVSTAENLVPIHDLMRSVTVGGAWYGAFMELLDITRGTNWQSRVDFRDPDDAGCPLYRFVDRYETVLEPGDVLWNPPFVWHGVMNVTESIAVSLWWTNVTRAFRNNVLLSTLTLCGRPNPIAMQLGFNHANADSKSHFGVHLNR